MRIAIAITDAGDADQGWGRAPRVAVADTRAGDIVTWNEFDVRWDQLHDAGSEGGHHARIARFLRDNSIDVVAAGHMGPPMMEMLKRMGIRAIVGVTGRARQVALQIAATASAAN